MITARAKLLLITFCFSLITVVLSQTNWQAHRTKDKYLTLRMPVGWISYNQSDADHKKTLAAIKKKNPQLSKLLSGSGDSKYALTLYNVNDDPSDGPDNMNVQVINNPSVSEKSMDDVRGRLAEIMGLDNGGDKLAHLGGLRTLIYWGDKSFTTPGGNPVHMQLRGYICFRDGKMIIFTFATTEGKMAKYEQTFDKVVASTTYRKK